MSSFSKIVASVVSIPVAFIKEVAEDVKLLEEEKAKRAAMPAQGPLDEEEQQLVAAARARKAAAAAKQQARQG